MHKWNLIYTHKTSMAFLAPIFRKLTDVQQWCMRTFFIMNFMHINKCGSTDRNTIIPVSTVQLWLYWLSQDTQSLSKFLLTSPVLNFIQIGQKKCRKYGHNFFTPISKVYASLDRFAQNSPLPVALCGDFLYQILHKSFKKCVKWVETNLCP
jgi:hypothetical protein